MRTLLREAIAAGTSSTRHRIVCGTGSDELLELAAQGFAGPGDEVLFSRNSFSLSTISPHGAAARCRSKRRMRITARMSMRCWQR